MTTEYTWAGAAKATTLASSVTNVTPAVGGTFVVLDATGHPSPSPTAPSILTFDRGLANEEKVLVDQRTGTTYRVLQRGYDGTAASAHTNGQTIIEHTIAATVMDRLTDHIKDAGDAHGPAGLATDAVTSAKIATGAVTEAKIGTAAVSATKLASNAVETAKILDANVTAAKLATNAVTTTKILDGNVTAAKLAAGAVTHIAAIAGFFRQNIGVSLALTQMARSSKDNGEFVLPVVVDRAGSIVGVTVAAKSGRTAGTLTVEVYKNGAATGLTAALNGSTPQYVATSQATALDTFVSGDRLDVRVTTDASWAPLANDIEATIVVGYS